MNRTRKRAARVYRQTWRDTFGKRPSLTKRPPLDIGKLDGGGAGEYDTGTGRIGLARSTAKSLASKKPMRRKMAQVTVAHELAHSQQGPQAKGVASEGGAQAYAQRYGKRELGLTARDYKRKGQRAYKGSVGRTRKRFGQAFITREQFRGPK